MEEVKDEWYRKWFDSPYYHLLYNNRDVAEAERFIENIIEYISPEPKSVILDAACGKGRHAIFMEKLGFQVDAFDISENNIKEAKLHQNEKLKFYINDIRKPLKLDYYDYAFNLFTSIGYFEREKDSKMTFESISKSLKNNGVFIIDFMNSENTINNLTKKEKIVKSNITFDIHRKYSPPFLIKKIDFIVDETHHSFQEKVWAFTLKDLEHYLGLFNFKIEKIFGDYQLSNFDEKLSKRLILIARKNE